MGKTSIEWTDRSWNPVTGCTKVSPGCDHCYAENIAHRFDGTKAYPNGFDVTLRPERLDQPLRWRHPARVFVNSMSDLFHADIPDDYIQRVWEVMWRSPQHTFQILTKRPGRMRSLLSRAAFYGLDMPWPLPNAWLGVSAEEQKWADIRIPQLLATPAAVRFISAEPLLGPIDIQAYVGRLPEDDDGAPYPGGLDWVIVGGESGHGARPMHPDWVCGLRNQCVRNNVAFHFKQWGQWVTEAQAPGDIILPGTSRWREFGTDDGPSVYKVGKTAAGRELDGRTWDEFPEVVA